MNWAFFRSRQFIIGTLAVIVLAAAITITVVLVTKHSPYMTIRALDGTDSAQRTVSDYNGSQLYLYNNGTFIFKIVYNDQPEFMGQGIYTKDGKTYIFTYRDMYRVFNNAYQQDTSNRYLSFTYNVVKSRIEISTPDLFMYYYFK